MGVHINHFLGSVPSTLNPLYIYVLQQVPMNKIQLLLSMQGKLDFHPEVDETAARQESASLGALLE